MRREHLGRRRHETRTAGLSESVTTDSDSDSSCRAAHRTMAGPELERQDDAPREPDAVAADSDSRGRGSACVLPVGRVLSRCRCHDDSDRQLTRIARRPGPDSDDRSHGMMPVRVRWQRHDHGDAILHSGQGRRRRLGRRRGSAPSESPLITVTTRTGLGSPLTRMRSRRSGLGTAESRVRVRVATVTMAAARPVAADSDGPSRVITV